MITIQPMMITASVNDNTIQPITVGNRVKGPLVELPGMHFNRYADTQSYHLFRNGRNYNTLHGLVCSENLFNRVTACSLGHCYSESNRVSGR